eukprot:SAG31_NODE_2415_length_5732_cov_7.567016_5_plen_68_part_00
MNERQVASHHEIEPYRVMLSRLVPTFSVRIWEIQKKKSHKIEKVTALTKHDPCAELRLVPRCRHACR